MFWGQPQTCLETYKLVRRSCPGSHMPHRPTIGRYGLDVISFDSRTPLVVISGTLTAQWYIDDILRRVMLLFLLQHPGLTFRHNNALPLTTHVAISYLQSCPTLPWSARLPNFSPIELIWNVVRRWLQSPRNIGDFVQHLETIWYEILQDTIL